jgi:uncharacterized protein
VTPVVGFASEGLTVVGEATHSVAPDMAELTVGVQTTSTSAAQALRENATRMLHVVQAIMALGVSQTDIETTALSVSPLYPLFYPQLGQPQWPMVSPYRQPGPSAIASEVQPLVGYRVSSTAKVVLRDTNRSGEMLDTAVAAGANSGIGIAFRLRDDAAVRRAVLEAAGREARAKADALAAAVGKQLGDPIRVSEDTSGLPTQGGELRRNGSVLPQGTFGGFLDGVHLNAPPGMPGELTIHARVQVTYRLC